MGEVVVIGSLNMDLVNYTERFPEVGETILGSGFAMVGGGKGANQAYAAANLGADVSIIGHVGDDAFGEQLIAGLQQVGVDTSKVARLANINTGIASIVVAGGNNFIILDGGANQRLSPQVIRSYEKHIFKASLVLLQMEIPFDTVQEVASICHSAGVPLLLDPAPARGLDDQLLSRVSYLTPNESEAAVLTGLPINSIPDATEAIRLLRERGGQTVIVTMGERGIVFNRGDTIEHRAALAVDAVDSTAAGDAFAGALAAALSSNMVISDAVDFAQRAAAFSVTKQGAQSSLPSRVELEETFL